MSFKKSSRQVIIHMEDKKLYDKGEVYYQVSHI